jgi:transcription initiation factor TFIIIB Brf1 subunit/transcription initiation factor TFIIB
MISKTIKPNIIRILHLFLNQDNSENQEQFNDKQAKFLIYKTSKNFRFINWIEKHYNYLINFKKGISRSDDKGRQGRSLKIRHLITSRNKQIETIIFDSLKETQLNFKKDFSCIYCGTDEFTREITHEHTLVCTSCGYVVCDYYISNCRADNYMASQQTITTSATTTNSFTGSKMRSKPYSTCVYFREKIAQLTCNDPFIYDEEMEIIEKEACYRINDRRENPYLWGKKNWSAICRSVGLGQYKYGERWIQLRVRFGLMDPPGINEIVINLLTYKFNIINNFIEKNNNNNCRGIAKKNNNIMNLNYILIQILRIIKYEIIFDTIKSFTKNSDKIDLLNDIKKLMFLTPQVSCQNKIKKYNIIWQNLIDDMDNSSLWIYLPLFKRDYFRCKAFI